MVFALGKLVNIYKMKKRFVFDGYSLLLKNRNDNFFKQY